MLRKKRDYLFNIAILGLYSIFVLYKKMIMSVSKSKNLERKLDNFAKEAKNELNNVCLLYTSPSPRDPHLSRMPSSA